MSLKQLFIIPFLALILVSCSSLKISKKYDKSVDFSSYKSFLMIPMDPGSSGMISEDEKDVLIAYTVEEMKKRGYVQKDISPDLAINITVVKQIESGVTNNTNPYTSYGYTYGTGYYSGYGYGMTGSTNKQYTLVKGTLVIDVFDTSEKRIIWQGTAKGTMEENTGKREKNIPKVVQNIFFGYPVRPK